MSRLRFFTTLVCLITVTCTSVFAQMPNYSYDAGPDRNTEMGRELIEITAEIPSFPEISNQIIGRKQKFRPAFGPIPWRMRQEPNSVKMLFIGQDGTHIAEAAGRPATAGFGGRAQDLAKYFGVNEGAAFINTYAFTIKGQYGVYNTPYIYKHENGEEEVRFSNLVSNKLWMITQDLSSPIVKWRNKLIDWIIRNNKKSMKLVVTFGGAARDAIAVYAKSKGAELTSWADQEMDRVQVPVTEEEYAGGNNTFPSLVNKDGKDLYAEMVGKKLSYSNTGDQKLATESLKNNLAEYIKKMVFTKGGPYNNGLLSGAQLSGYNIGGMVINGMKTRSLKGLELNDGTKIENDILVVELPHPSSLSRTVIEASDYNEGKRMASARVMAKVRALNYYRDNPEIAWRIEPDAGLENEFDQGKDYTYGRSDIGPEFYDFGTPENRMVSKSTAKRMGGAANVVIIGTRENGQFDRKEIKKMTDAKPAPGISNQELYIARPRTEAARFEFDAGPGEEMAKIMKENLNFSEIYATKEGKTFETDGIDAYNIETHPSVGDFGHYRGTFNNPKVVILADPHGYDDIVTARALTGTRGQYLQGLMNDLGVSEDHLIIKTVPFGMDGATDEEWAVTLEKTKGYRDAVLGKVLENGTPLLVISDGKHATAEAMRILEGKNIPHIYIRRGKNADSGIKSAGRYITKKIEAFKNARPSGKIANIPRAHLSFYSRTWEGTSGDRVLMSEGLAFKGIAFAEVVPAWAYRQKAPIAESTDVGIDAMIQVLRDNGLVLPNESIPTYIHRMSGHF